LVVAWGGWTLAGAGDTTFSVGLGKGSGSFAVTEGGADTGAGSLLTGNKGGCACGWEAGRGDNKATAKGVEDKAKPSTNQRRWERSRASKGKGLGKDDLFIKKKG